MSKPLATALQILPPAIELEETYTTLAVPVASGGTHDRVAVGKIDLGGSRAADLRFEEATFAGTILRGVIWHGATFLDVRWRACEASNADLRQSSWQRVAWESCNLTGVNLTSAQLRHARFERSKLVLAQFAQARFVDAAFCNCQLEQADFSQADLRGVVFAGCNLTGARLHGANLQDADLRGSNLTALGATATDLRGAIVDASQLLQLAPLLGVVVE